MVWAVTEAKTPQTDQTVRWIEDFSRQWAAAWNDHDPDGLEALCHPEIERDDPAARRVLRGRAEVREWVGKTLEAFPDAVFATLGIYAGPVGTAAALHCRMEARALGPLDPPGFASTGRRARRCNQPNSHVVRPAAARSRRRSAHDLGELR